MKSGLPSARPAMSRRASEGSSDPEESLDHRVDLRRWEAVQGDARVVGRVSEGQRIAGAVGQQDDDPRSRGGVQQEAEDLLRVLVDPMEILDGEDDRASCTLPEEDGAEGFGRPAMTKGWPHGRDLGIRWIEREERSDERHGPAEVVPDPSDACLDLGPNGADVVALIDMQELPEHVEDRQIGDRPAVGDAAAVSQRAPADST